MMTGSMPLVQRRIAQIAVIVVLFALWHLSLQLHFVSPSGIPWPTTTFASLAALLRTSDFWFAVGQTLAGWATGLVICAVFGITAGFAIGLSQNATTSTRLLIDFIRTIPPVALVPLLLLLYGPTPGMKLALVISGAIWPLVIQSIYAAGQVDPTLMQVSRSFRLGWRERVFDLYVPSALPFVSTGLRVASTISLLLCIAGELLGGAPGVGKEIGAAEINGDLPTMYAYVITAAGLGVMLNTILVMVQRRVLWWHPSIRGEKRP
jgi:ABC-type nitrate/sulfonate/bicarbonate transport system permease component